ncbi:TonB-dependent receptor plug domain-containing protein [Hymenobacter sp. NST-14]|uniref:TonB-dependent receptor plug domain-containing protein n=1 Tax=Hymenobacter piscis TaxID=2839984 RepID=UPI001C038B2B|nr:TonB-dependent receptor plug domain-containing protein [Hymenobacter piscis]MBT9393256.1 TonB-dependent receptor plug domain-containing protein [Hymenobacter piscis]
MPKSTLLRFCWPVSLLALGLVAFRSDDTGPDPARLVEQLRYFYRVAQPEVSYLHLDQAAYAAGETLWFKAYVVDARAHQPDSLSRVLYVDVVTPEKQVIFQRTLALDQGLAAGDIILPDTLSSGMYTLRAYTSWMRNSGEGLFFTRRVPVWQAAVPASGGAAPSALRRAALARTTARQVAAAQAPDVQFFPEGGNYVAGMPTTVGVKAVAANGHGLALQGSVLDEQGKEVARFSTPALGMSSFNFTPRASQRYRASVDLPDGEKATYALPVVQETGWLLNVREIGDDYRVFVRHRGGGVARPLQLVAHVRGEVVYTGMGQIREGETFLAMIPKANAPAGLLHITLFDGQRVAQAERLVFVPETQGLQVRLRPSRASYGPREKVDLEVEVTTATGQPAAAELSLAVTNRLTLPGAAAEATDVRAHLLLTSELRGYVENPAYYFQPRTPDVQRALNDLLLTQGWSRFSWQQVLGPVPADYRFPLERTLTLSGQVMRNKNNTMPDGQLTLLYGKDLHLIQTTAGPDGRFLFKGFPGQDTTSVLLQARTPKGNDNVVFKLNELWPGPAETWRPVAPLSPVTAESEAVVAYGQRSRRQQMLERAFRPDSTSGIVLREVRIDGRTPDDSPYSLHRGTASVVIRLSDYPNQGYYSDIFQVIQARAPGVQVTRDGEQYIVRVQGTASSHDGSPLYLLDNVELNNGEALLSVYPADVQRIEIVKGAAAWVYGSRGGNGVIAVYTKQGSGRPGAGPSPAGIAVRRMPAYYRAREFYAPRYETSRQTEKPDPRATTLYWLPRLTVPASGRAQVSFFTADQAGTFRAAVEGISAGGQPATAEAALTVGEQP